MTTSACSSVAVLSTIPRLSQHLKLALPNVSFTDVPADDSTRSRLSNAEIIVADANLLIGHVGNLPTTKWVQMTWAGVEGFVAKLRDSKTTPPNFQVTRFSGQSFGYAMSEYVVAQIVNFERDQRRQYENQSRAKWEQSGRVSDHRRLCELTVGILGVGEIGGFLAKVLKTLGARVWGMSRSPPAEISEKDFKRRNLHHLDAHVTGASLAKLLESCDYVVNVMPSTDSTRGLLNGDALKSCAARGSVFVNIGRGSVIDESDLINALERKWISGAILDVFENEPLSEHSKLWSFPQVTISPHVAGISKPEDIAQVFAANYVRYTAGKSLQNVLDHNRGY
ncbi:hypothetical protein TKK_0007189 [Trichogramma kaykai]|uniref:D-isomer specific 2-hydroxyacid dehydrogenase NAD-binding domain-containing protein n=1 Tax=Trichogramma kaykai TaxID=54128 RepID=A0ABD2X8V5_9HYME